MARLDALPGKGSDPSRSKADDKATEEHPGDSGDATHDVSARETEHREDERDEYDNGSDEQAGGLHRLHHACDAAHVDARCRVCHAGQRSECRDLTERFSKAGDVLFSPSSFPGVRSAASDVDGL